LLNETPIWQQALKELNKPQVKQSQAYKAALAKVEAANVPDNQRDHELLAYMIQDSPKSGIVTRLINKIRQWLRDNFGLTKPTLPEIRQEVEAWLESKRTANPNPDSGLVNDNQKSYAVNERLNESIGSSNKITDFLRNTKENWRPQWLGLLTLRQLADIGQQYLPQLKDYVDINTQMQTDRNSASEEYNDLAESWRKWAARNKPMADKLANVMHKATLAGIDPSEGTSNTQPTQQARQLNNLWKQLTPKAQELFQDVRDSYALQQIRMVDALLDRISHSELSGNQKEAMRLEIRRQFETGRDAKAYFPLSRFGDFWLAGRDAEDNKYFSMYESHAQLKQAESNLKTQGYTNITTGRKLDQARLSDADEGLMGDFINVLEKNGISKSDPVMDDIYQAFLKAMPSVSMRTSFIHRQGTPGYSPDALRGYA
ncbi:MAG: PLxRFG domain-containing protein, partial [Gammaproteobacteria bacterium]|nr:PLxRFG domain-containing protein [Gammaproteobacteria bacterium]